MAYVVDRMDAGHGRACAPGDESLLEDAAGGGVERAPVGRDAQDPVEPVVPVG